MSVCIHQSTRSLLHKTIIFNDRVFTNTELCTHFQVSIHSFIHQYSALRPVRQEPEPSQATGMALAVAFPRLQTFPPSPLGAFTTRETPNSGRWNSSWARNVPKISSRIRLPRNSRLLHAANLRHGTDGFTSPPKEGVLRIFSPLKIRRLRPGLNPRTWVPKASTLPLEHRSR